MSEASRRPVVIISQARYGSSRLPGKVLKSLCGKPLLWWHLSRLLRAREADRVVVATTEEPEAAAIVDIARDLGIDAYRGSLTDVLDRFRQTAAMAHAATIVRVTSDCPLIDPAVIDLAIRTYLDDPACDYCSLDIGRAPRGLDCEVISRVALDEAAAHATEAADREHVTSFIRDHSADYSLRFIAPDDAEPRQRWCVDTAADFTHVERLLGKITGGEERLDFGWRELAALDETECSDSCERLTTARLVRPDTAQALPSARRRRG